MSIISKIKKYGFSGVFKILLKKIFQIEIMQFNYLKIELDCNSIQNKLQKIELHAKELNYNDFLLGERSEFNDKKLEVIKERFNDSSYKAYGIVNNEILIYSSWISLKKLGLPVKSNIQLKASEGYLEDDYCHTEYRGRGIHSKMNLFRLHKLCELGKKECIIVIKNSNTPAINTQINAGAKNLGSFKAGTIFGFSFVNLNKSKYDSQ